MSIFNLEKIAELSVGKFHRVLFYQTREVFGQMEDIDNPKDFDWLDNTMVILFQKNPNNGEFEGVLDSGVIPKSSAMEIYKVIRGTKNMSVESLKKLLTS
jgi:ribosomal protein L22